MNYSAGQLLYKCSRIMAWIHHTRCTENGILEKLPKRKFRKASSKNSNAEHPDFEIYGIVVDFRKLLLSDVTIIPTVRIATEG